MTNEECLEILKRLPLTIDLDGMEDANEAIEKAIGLLERRIEADGYYTK